MILGQIGWRVETIAGGYKAYRALVVDRLYAQPFPSPVILLDGNTGTAKTVLLDLLAARGVQVIDLEALARHRGSLFGGMAGGQPSQKAFETGLAMAVARLDPAKPVVIEAESSKIGQCRIPVSVWKAMLTAPRIEVAAPLDARARFLVTRYPDLVQDADQLRSVIASLRRLQPAERLEVWQKLADAGDFGALAEGLMTHHYDPRYKRNRDQNVAPVARVALGAMEDADLEQAADRLAGLVSAR
jgi:tRNA 2-selenouridine synthase